MSGLTERGYSHRCPDHPEADLLPLPNCYSGPLVCETCHGRICHRCSSKGASWMSGTCDNCYRIIGREQRDQRERDDNERLERIAQQQADAAVAEALAPIEALADKWEALQKGESATTQQLRTAIRDGRGAP